MAGLDLLIIVVYALTLVYVARQALGEMEDWATVQLDRDGLKEELNRADLQGKVNINVGLKPRYGFEPIADLALSISNSSPAPIYVDWDRSSLTNFQGRSRRVIRVTPSMNLDLSRPQVFSVIAPGKSLSERVVAEDMLKRTPEGILQVAAPLVDLGAARGLPDEGKLEFSLRLLLLLVEQERQVDDDVTTHAVLCRFIVRRIPWNHDIPWLRNK